MKTPFVLILLSLTFGCAPANADPDDSILTTYTENGLRQFDIKAGTFLQNGQPSQDAAIAGLGFGITDSWFSELYLGYVKSGSDSISFDSAALQNTFVLTGEEAPVEVGLYTEIEYEQDRTAGETFSFGPLLETEFGLTKINLNLIFQRNYRAQQANPMSMGYQWQIRQRMNAQFDLGVQGFGQLGAWNQWAPKDQQEHRIGPALFGKIALDDNHLINYNAAILFDVFDGVRATTLRCQAVLGF